MLLLGAPVLALAFVSAGAPAQEAVWRPVSGQAPPVIAATPSNSAPAQSVTLARPVALAPASPTRAVALDRPMPLGPGREQGAVSDPQVQPASFQWSSPATPALYRGQSPDAQPMPVGMPVSARRSVASSTSFAIEDEPLPAPTPMAPTPVAPPPTLVPDPAPSSPLPGAPLRPIPDGVVMPDGVCVDDCPPSDAPCCITGDGACCLDGCCACGDSYRLYGGVEYLLWWVSGMKLPPLVTTSPPTSLGVIGMPGTTLVIGGNDAVDPMRSGLRATIGWWIDPEQTWAVEGTVFGLARQSKVLGANSPGFPLLARPFFDVLVGAQDSELVANPLIPSLPMLLPLSGTVVVATTSELWGGQANVVRNIYRGPVTQVDLFGGFRYLSLLEKLDIGESLAVPFTSPAAGGMSFLVADSFHTHNQFYGGQIGARGEVHLGSWFLNLRGGVSFGTTHQTAEINGYTVIAGPGTPALTFPGGLLAQPSNSGRFTNNTFSVVPEAGLNVGYQLTDYCRIFVGYSFLYWSDVARPGNQIDLGVNPLQVRPPRIAVGPARPAFYFKDSDFWAQGINLGVELRY
jgi:hypothetical protein